MQGPVTVSCLVLLLLCGHAEGARIVLRGHTLVAPAAVAPARRLASAVTPHGAGAARRLAGAAQVGRDTYMYNDWLTQVSGWGSMRGWCALWQLPAQRPAVTAPSCERCLRYLPVTRPDLQPID